MIKPYSITGIGSMPQLDPSAACEMVLKYFDIPFWPQMPKISFRELMIPQFSEGLPGVVIEGDKIYVKYDEENIMEWLSNYREDEESPISEDFAIALYKISELLKKEKVDIFKGQITGPMTFTLSLRDEEGKPVYFNETYREVCLLHLKAKAKWQINFLKKFSKEVIIFIDEPILQAIGTSTYISVDQQEAARLINDIALFIKQVGAFVGLHCCGRGDWREILNYHLDILSFDAYFFFELFKIYKEEIKNFIDEKNGYIAWGFIPTTDDLKSLGDDEILNKAKTNITELSREIPALEEKSIITPSCGMGSLDESDAERVCRLLRKLQSLL